MRALDLSVILEMVLTDGGVGTLTCTGLLDHNVFPPTIAGTITPWSPAG